MIREFTVLEFAQLAEKLNRRMKQMYKHLFRPSRDPQKGYQATWKNFFEATLAPSDDTMMSGTVIISDDGDYVAQQMWETVSKIITFSSKYMRKLFAVLGVLNNEISPFCRSFSSRIDLRDELIRYLPRTFTYEDVQGNADDPAGAMQDDDNDEGKDDFAELIEDRIKRFGEEMTKANDSGKKGKDDNDIIVLGGDDELTAEDQTPSTSTIAGSKSHAEKLMSSFRSMIVSTSIEELQDRVLTASASLACTEHVMGSTSKERKVKSLVQRWIASPPERIKSNEDGEVVAEDILIERDVVIIANVKIGNGANATTVQRPFRVMVIHDKHYNKWMISQSSSKKWGKEAKPYKVDIRMLRKNEVGEYEDVELYDADYNKEEVAKRIGENLILDVVGKLHVIG